MENHSRGSSNSLTQLPIAEFTGDLEKFSNYLYNQLSAGSPKKNIIFSPFSIQTCAAMLLMGADNNTETFQELKDGLQFTSSSINRIANSFDAILTAYQQYNVLKTAHKVYIMDGFELEKEYNHILTRKFHSKPETINFANSTEAANHINSWVESRTNKLIKNIISADMLNSLTRLVLINAIHFKGEWEVRFEDKDTQEEDFYLNDSQRIRVSMMHVENDFLYAELKELDATALQMNYKDCDLSMLVVLPNTKTGLKYVERKLQSTPLRKITDLLTKITVDVKMPKFKAEFQQELSSIFKTLGLKRIFGDDAELGKILSSKDPIKVSHIFHKAFIEVNEMGTEAAAATAMVMMIRTLPSPPSIPKQFYVNKPFFYTIFHRSYGHLFMGHVVSEFAADSDAKYSKLNNDIAVGHHIKIPFQANRPFFYGILNSDRVRFLEGVFQG